MCVDTFKSKILPCKKVKILFLGQPPPSASEKLEVVRTLRITAKLIMRQRKLSCGLSL